MRLPWWLFVAAIAAEGALLLPPSSSAPGLAWWLQARDTIRTPLEGRVAVLEEARARAAFRAQVARSEAALRPWLEGPGGTVLVLDRAADGRLVVDRERTAAAESLWALLPARDRRVRTLVLPGQGVSVPAGWRAQGDHGVCLGHWFSTGGVWVRQREVGAQLGYCAFASAFGPPGAKMREWVELGSPFWPGVEWFKGAWSDGTAAPDDDPRWAPSVLDRIRQFRASAWWDARTSARAADRFACEYGRTDRCLAGYGLAEIGGDRGRAWNDLVRFTPPLVDLLHALGPERFGEVWRSEAPVPEAYAAATGASLAEWLTGRPASRYGRAAPR
ncbi:MAG TPA: hypothetical protein VFS07_00720, partial [Gemmatimonadales bacterium]|nr:hypothetical protein [Gemmatimonadales bacterium]